MPLAPLKLRPFVTVEMWILLSLLLPVLQLHLAAMSSLKGEVIELSGRLQRLHAEKDILDKQFAKLHVWRLFLIY